MTNPTTTQWVNSHRLRIFYRTNSLFNANALYFLISALSLNIFAMMRQLLPEELASHHAITIRCRLYTIAANVVNTGRQLFVKLHTKHQPLPEQVLAALRRFGPPPI